MSESLILREVSSVVVAKVEGRPFPEFERRLGGKSVICWPCVVK